MYNNALFIIFIIWVIALLIFYHKVFTVHYFSLGQGLLKELVGAVILGALMTGLTLMFWWLSVIVILIYGIVMSKRFSNNTILIGCIVLAIIITILGIRFNADRKNDEIKENQTNESSESDERESTYSIVDDKKSDFIDSDYLDNLFNTESQKSEETAEEVYSEFIYRDDIPTTNVSASEYILKDSSIRYLTKEELQGLSSDECRLARNEIYARNGRKFDDEGLQSYFNACSWYQGTIDPNDFQENMLSDIEVANKNLIIEYEKEMGYR